MSRAAQIPGTRGLRPHPHLRRQCDRSVGARSGSGVGTGAADKGRDRTDRETQKLGELEYESMNPASGSPQRDDCRDATPPNVEISAAIISLGDTPQHPRDTLAAQSQGYTP